MAFLTKCEKVCEDSLRWGHGYLIIWHHLVDRVRQGEAVWSRFVFITNFVSSGMDWQTKRLLSVLECKYVPNILIILGYTNMQILARVFLYTENNYLTPLHWFWQNIKTKYIYFFLFSSSFSFPESDLAAVRLVRSYLPSSFTVKFNFTQLQY